MLFFSWHCILAFDQEIDTGRHYFVSIVLSWRFVSNFTFAPLRGNRTGSCPVHILHGNDHHGFFALNAEMAHKNYTATFSSYDAANRAGDVSSVFDS